MTKMPYPCPCCGYQVFDEPPGSYNICPICNWEDDISQLRFFEMSGGANKLSLLECQKKFRAIGASDPRFVGNVRQPTATDLRDPEWRPLDGERERQEKTDKGKDHGETYPKDSTALYYWRKKPAQ